MDKEQQNIAWASIPKDVRTLLRQEYAKPIIDDFSEGYNSALNDIFGDENLTSDEEPEEIFVVSKKTLEEKYNAVVIAANTCDSVECAIIQDLLEDIFGKDKCLPDKVIISGAEISADGIKIPDPSEEKPSNGAIGTTPPASKLDVKPTPKFRVGDNVIVTSKDKRGTTGSIVYMEYASNGDWYYRIEDDGDWLYSEKNLAPYTEPEFKIGDKVTMEDEAKISYNGVGTIIEVRNNHGYAFYRIKEHPALFAEQYLKPYTEPEPRQTEETMEEKELNLLTLLKGAIGETFYCPMWGDTKICSTAVDGYRIEPKDKVSGYLNIGFDGKADEDGHCILYPSRALYIKYPLDAAKAWQIWAEEKKPKRWIPKHGDKVWCLNVSLNPMWEINNLPPSKWVDELNCFQTQELCQQAAEEVKRTLMEFHEKNAEK